MTHPTAAERYRQHLEQSVARNRFLAVAGGLLLVAVLLLAPAFLEATH